MTITLLGLQIWPRPARKHRTHLHVSHPVDARSLHQRWEDGPVVPRRPRPEVGSMQLRAEQAYRGRGPCDDTGEHAATVMFPRFGYPDQLPRSGRFWSPPGGIANTITPAYQARNLDPRCWRPYLTEQEFAESFPGVPYALADDDGGPQTGDLLGPLDPRLADQLDQLAAETEDWLAQRAAAHADARARLIIAWQAIWQHS